MQIIDTNKIDKQKQDNPERAFKGVWIPKEIWLDKNLSWMEKLLLTEINSLDNDDGCFASNNYFARFFQLSPGRISQLINSLKNKGYVTIEYEREGKNIIKRVVRILNRGIKYSKGAIENIKEGYLENYKDNNTKNNNIKNNINILSGNPTPSVDDPVNKSKKKKDNIPYKEIIDYLNEKVGTHYRYQTEITRKLVRARWQEGFRLEDFKKVIDNKCDDWLNDSNMEKYLRPQTLFSPKFESYLNKPKYVMSESVLRAIRGEV